MSRISSAVLCHTKGLGLSFQVTTQAFISSEGCNAAMRRSLQHLSGELCEPSLDPALSPMTFAGTSE